MENLNAEQIKKALECCENHEGDNCPDCPYHYTANGFNHNCKEDMCVDALALITSQEQRIAELEIELKAMRGAANAYKMHIVELTEENERLSNRVTATIVLTEKDAERIKNECLERVELDIKAIKADTIQEYRESLHREFASLDAKDKFNKALFLTRADQIAKEMVEGEK